MLIGDKVRLRALERSDLPAVVRWMNDPGVTEHLLNAPLTGLQEMEAWYEGNIGSNDRLLAILDPRGDLVGYCGISRLEWEDRRCNLWITIGECDAWDKGYGTDTVRTMLRYLFDELNLNRVSLTVAEDNARAIRVYERCGFIREGIARKARFKYGTYRNDVTMAIVKEAWGR
ncbi:MAG: GNAT family N-acetyltransferase [Euryarchaeota archaeon]|nr:GNAT family N-acetyltransferase [Euryarchaeota archaeon]